MQILQSNVTESLRACYGCMNKLLLILHKIPLVGKQNIPCYFYVTLSLKIPGKIINCINIKGCDTLYRTP